MKSAREYIVKVIARLTSHCVLDLDPALEYEVIRMLIEVAEENE